MQNRIESLSDFEKKISLGGPEKAGFEENNFKISCTPYYAELAKSAPVLQRAIVPTIQENQWGAQQMDDPLGERKNLSSSRRLVHRYSDRVLFLVTDMCGAYCRYCFRKYFTGHDQGFVGSADYKRALEYIAKRKGIREVILSGGDPLTLSNNLISKILSDLRSIEHIEIIRIGSRMPVFSPMRIDAELLGIFKTHKPIYFMSHINHPKEVSLEVASALESLVDSGVPVFNQAVLLNGLNNHEAVIQALNRRLIYLRVKPHYLFQCDPSHGTDHLRTSIETGEKIQRALWGHLSGLAMAQHSLDIPGGGGKTTLVPQFTQKISKESRTYRGWDGVSGEYINPVGQETAPLDLGDYLDEWEEIKKSRDSKDRVIPIPMADI